MHMYAKSFGLTITSLNRLQFPFNGNSNTRDMVALVEKNVDRSFFTVAIIHEILFLYRQRVIHTTYLSSNFKNLFQKL